MIDSEECGMRIGWAKVLCALPIGAGDLVDLTGRWELQIVAVVVVVGGALEHLIVVMPRRSSSGGKGDERARSG